MKFAHKIMFGTLLTAVMGSASAANFVTNGSFEMGADGFDGWTLGGTQAVQTPAAIYYGLASPYPDGAFGEAVPANNAPTNSPDAVGDRAAYFVDDGATNQSLSQQVTLAEGLYQIGFSSYAPANGWANIHDATFAGIIASVELANYSVGSGPQTTWQTFSGAINLAAGDYTVEFVFNTPGAGVAKDVVIDQVYIVAGNPTVGVPEPGALALLGLSMLGLGLLRRRRTA